MKQGPDGPFNDPRPIRYAAHLDRCIYQYYSALLNAKYNELTADLGIGDSAIAYRTNMKGKSNCDFALRAFSAMREMGDCFVCAGDFKSFFETLDHGYLKGQVRRLFDGGLIPDDYYHVLKGATKYSVWDIKDLLSYHGLPYSKSGIKRLNQRDRVLEPGVFRRLAKSFVTRPWKDNGGAGIPQGLPISGVLANIYMLEFDKAMCDAAESAGGLYMRYSDDFIFIAPSVGSFAEICQTLNQLCDGVPKLELHPDKTQKYILRDGVAYLTDESLTVAEGERSTRIDYLGFAFDGKVVRLRQKTIWRFYRRMYRRISSIYRWKYMPGKKRVDKLYLDFSDWGRVPWGNIKVRHRVGDGGRSGNFLSYAERAQAAFPSDPISEDVAQHKRKIRNRVKRIREKKFGEKGRYARFGKRKK